MTDPWKVLPKWLIYNKIQPSWMLHEFFCTILYVTKGFLNDFHWSIQTFPCLNFIYCLGYPVLKSQSISALTRSDLKNIRADQRCFSSHSALNITWKRPNSTDSILKQCSRVLIFVGFKRTFFWTFVIFFRIVSECLRFERKRTIENSWNRFTGQINHNKSSFE